LDEVESFEKGMSNRMWFGIFKNADSAIQTFARIVNDEDAEKERGEYW
jgi:hypothetical protein